MSIKDLFGKRSNKILTVEKYEEAVKRDGESSEHVEERNEDQSRFVPRITVDFDDPKTFARYGSAEKYYTDAINSVLNAYPYDGSLAEKTEWHNVATYIDNYIFENEYPRTTGYVKFNNEEEHPQTGILEGYRYVENPQFIYVKGGPNPTPINETGELRKEYPEGLGKSNIWKPDLQRESNLYCTGDSGNTVEFWFKLTEERSAVDGDLCLFDLWNNHALGTEQYCRFMVELPEDKASAQPLLQVTYASGSAGAENILIGDRENISEKFNFNNWNHFSVSVFNLESSLCFRFYLNGELVEEVQDGTPVQSFVGETNHLTATLGAMQHKKSETEHAMYGFGAARANYDEFRFWKEVRTSEQIGRNWFTQIHGGNNSDVSNTDLGVYYKFNEGIYNSEEINGFDRQVLDYSGRVSNGSIVNYSLSVRDLGSAIDEKPGVKNEEFKDPIIYRSHPLVKELLEAKKLEGGAHDMKNNSAVYNTLPEWITSDDENQGGNSLLDLSQIVCSYFDTLHLQIEALPTITNTHYVQDGEKPLPFANHLLESVGFVAPEIFVDTTILEALSNRNEERVFEEKIHNVKNLIYQNIYNNIVGIYKAKGTEKSFRNLLRCFGVGDELIKINLYGDGVKHRLEDSYRSVSVKKNYLDFNDVDRHDSTVYQELEPDNPHSTSYISGTNDGSLDFVPFTMESSVIFPKKLPIDHPKYYKMDFGYTDDEPSSIFGMHQAKDDEADLTWFEDPDFGFRVVVIKQEEFSPHAKFRLDVRGFGLEANSENEYRNGVFETEFYYDVYDNTRWNFAVRVRTDKDPDLVYKSDENVKYYLEFYGLSTILDQVQEEFLFELEIDPEAAKLALNANKRLFLGAEYVDTNDNFAGTINQSDVKIGEVRYWQDYLENSVIKYHAQDPDNYGVMDPYKPAYFEQQSVGRRVPQIDTLCLYWDFATVTTSSVSDGIEGVGNILSDSFFYVDDVSAGSTAESALTGRYAWIGKTVKSQHTGKGDYYYPEDRHVVDRNFLFAAKQNLPEIIGSTDTVKLLTQDDDYFVKNIRPVNYFWAVEKSMYQSISQEIVEAFAGIHAFNNLIGEPVNRYRMEYKNLNKLRQLFFQKFQEAPRIERYIQFYKWIDSSISDMIRQLIPASANFSDDMRTMIESHVLERNKYWTKFPTLEMKQEPPETPLLGINEMLYNWRLGHATLVEDEKCVWWRDRAERDGDELTSGDSAVDESKNQILHVATTKNDGPYIKKKLAHEVGALTKSYDGQTFAVRSLSTPYRFEVDILTDLHGGVNNKKNKKIDYVRAQVGDGAEVSVSPTTQPQNSSCVDEVLVENPLLNTRLNIEAEEGNGSTYSLYEVNQNLVSGETYWNSNHSDSYGEDKEVPMQGVFPSIHVGGLQSRHVPLNDGEDIYPERPEAWNFDIDEEVGTFRPLDKDQPKAKYYRDEKAKRPVNIRNIKSSYGNYRFDYEVVQTSGRTNNNRWLAELDSLDLVSEHVVALRPDVEISVPTRSLSTESDYVLEMYDFRLPERRRQEHIFSERFSSPGGPDTLSRGMLDIEAEEFAVYNALTYRNLDVRTHLQNWFTYHTKKWGYRSYHRGTPVEDCESPTDGGVFCEANYHKIHRNTSYRPEPFDYIEYKGRFYDQITIPEDPCCECDDDELTVYTVEGAGYRCKETHDNFWVTQLLPRSGHQYSWIKASTRKGIFEEITEFDEVLEYSVCPWGYATDFPNAVAYHPETNTNPTTTIGTPPVRTYGKSVVKRESFDNLEGHTIRMEEGFPFLNKFLNYELDGLKKHPSSYEEVSGEPIKDCQEVSATVQIRGMNIADENTYTVLNPDSGTLTLNNLLLHRNGPYQHPSWKQIRNVENKIVQDQRKSNIFSILDLPGEIMTATSAGIDSFRERRAQTAKSYVEPAVSWNMPLRHKVQFPGSETAGVIVHSYSNNIEVFANPYLDKRIGLQKTARQIYDVMVDKYMDPENVFAPKLYEMTYGEYIFPKHRNTGLDKIRRRKNYSETEQEINRRSSMIRTFWASDGLRERARYLPGTQGVRALNALGAEVRRGSVWALDYAPQETTLDDQFTPGGQICLRGDLTWAGYAQYAGYTSEGIYSAADVSLDLEYMESGQQWIAPRPRLQFIHNPRSNKAPEQAWKWKAAEIADNTPWHEDYDEFSKDIRIIGKNYSLTPEYNVSSHMEYYINDSAGNFKAENKNLFELPGATVSSSATEAAVQTSYFWSWDGSDSDTGVLKFWNNGKAVLTQPNFAAGWTSFFEGQTRNLRLPTDISQSTDKAYRLFNRYCPTEAPISLDQVGKSRWKCKDPRTVGKYEEGAYFSVRLKDAFDSEEQLGDAIPTEMQSGLPIVSTSTATTVEDIDWSMGDALNANKNAVRDAWDNVVFLSAWVNLEGEERQPQIPTIFEFTSGVGVVTTEEPEKLVYPDGRVFDIGPRRQELELKTTEYEKKVAELSSQRRVRILNDATQKAVTTKINKLQYDLGVLKPRIDDLRLQISDATIRAITATTNEPSLRSLKSTLMLDEKYQRLKWYDNSGNSLIIGDSETYEHVRSGWVNISVCYVGAPVNSNPKQGRHRVLVFVDGEYVKSELDPLTNQHADMFEQGDPMLNDGTLIYKEQYPASFNNIRLGGFSGKATDLMLFRGNPGITIYGDPLASERLHTDVAAHRFFFDTYANNLLGMPTGIYYGTHDWDEEENPPLQATLAKMIFDKQCEDANELYKEWREYMNACDTKPNIPRRPSLLGPMLAYPTIQLELEESIRIFENNLFPDAALVDAALVSQVAELESTEEDLTVSPPTGEELQSILTMGQSFTTDNIAVRPSLISTTDVAELPESATDVADIISDMYQIGATDSSVVDPGESESEEPVEVIEQGKDARCAELIGWWKLSPDRLEKSKKEESVWQEEFFKCYSHTDNLPHIDKFREDHKSFGASGTELLMRLEVNAIKKLLPYNGFYPSQRCVQLGSLFYDSVISGGKVEGENDEQTEDRYRTEQAALQPFFAPGILFNTIKSGIAVDWAAYASLDDNIDTFGSEIYTKDDGKINFKLPTFTNTSSYVLPTASSFGSFSVENFQNTPAHQIVLKKTADDLEMQMSLRRVVTDDEQKQFIKTQYKQNLDLLRVEVSDFALEVQKECTQREYDRYVKNNGFVKNSDASVKKFREAYGCQEFTPNAGTRTVSFPAVESVLGKPNLLTGTDVEISAAAAEAIEIVERVPEEVGPTLTISGNRNYRNEGRFIGKAPTFRIPFEALVSLNSYLPQKNSDEASKIFFLAPSHYPNESVSGAYSESDRYPYFEWAGDQNPLYEMAMNNFLAEIPNFFLRDSKFTTFASAPENKFKTVKKGWTYYMDVHLYKTDGFDMTMSPHDGELIRFGTSKGGRQPKEFTSQGRYFGPSLQYLSQNDVQDTALTGTGFQVSDPAQAAYVPPYFYGRAKARLKFVATRDGQPTLEEILNNVEIDYINEEMDRLFATRSSNTITGKQLLRGVADYAWKQSPAYKGRMPIESCIKFDGKAYERRTSYAAINTAYDYSPDGVQRLAPTQVQDEIAGTGVWVISPRFECPTFNFNTPDNAEYIKGDGDLPCGTGIWGGYGTIPTGQEGVYISLEESFKSRSKPNKPILCEVTNLEIYAVALGIPYDVRNLHENTITLEDPYGNVETITIGQPTGVENIASWSDEQEIDNSLAKLIDLSPMSGKQPFSKSACIRTTGTTPGMTIQEVGKKMQGQYDIEANLQADKWMTDVFALWNDPSERVPLASDFANAIQYHISYRRNTDKSFPWKAKVVWVSDIAATLSTPLGSSKNVKFHSKDSAYNKLQNVAHAVIQIEYDHTKAPKDKKKINEKPLISLAVNQDSVRNPNGRLGLKYLTESNAMDWSRDSFDPESQMKREFYYKSDTEKVITCVEAVGSLIDVCGFTATKSRLGEVAPSKEISEAVVMIPFVDNPINGGVNAPTTQIAGRNFFRISDQLFAETKANVEAGEPAIIQGKTYNVASDIPETSVSEMIKRAQKYNLPPQFDFLKYREINPFVMYIFEFSEVLKSSDLSDIWQGLMPERAKTARQDAQVIEHEMNEINFFEGKKVPKNIRWMVFRVKKRAKTNYWEMTADSVDDDRFKFDFTFGSDSTPDYNYNWPYDFCSLVELCQVKGGISLAPKRPDMVVERQPILSDAEKRRIISEAHTQSGASQGAQVSGLTNWSSEDDE